ncbi:MAG: LON peptidase substrate-binding domain-containing protein [Chromatiaceae bacterium]|jgi:hypothetical protein|nr:LON peptidase substrate-binding domain-containing protein [Chromatiaceae bacterium]
MTRSPFLPRFSNLPDELPIFPLAAAVVMPGVQLPLNIFEPRYLNMVTDALAADHLIGMIQPKPESALDHTPEVHQVGCAGRITSYSETNDGRILLVLTGICRFDVRGELDIKRGYRRVAAAWERFAIDFHEDESRLADRESFLTSLRSYASLRAIEVPWAELEKMADAEMVNLLCTHLPLEAEDKQALLATLDLVERAALMRGLMDMSSVSSVQTAEHRH